MPISGYIFGMAKMVIRVFHAQIWFVVWYEKQKRLVELLRVHTRVCGLCLDMGKTVVS